MDIVLIYVIIASFGISLISLVGAALFVVQEKKLRKYMILFVALAAGSLLGTAFLHLIPESFEMHESALEGVSSVVDNVHSHEIFWPSYFILFGIIVFYFIEKFIHWHHHHEMDCHSHSVTTLSLVGDWFHNLIDGIVMGAAFAADVRLGVVTTIAIALHEIPQEIGDLSILLHGGFSRGKALFWNFFSGFSSVIGAVLTYFFLDAQAYIPLLLAFTAGMFIYISLADIIPEMHKKHEIGRTLISVMFFLGMIITFVMTNFIGH